MSPAAGRSIAVNPCYASTQGALQGVVSEVRPNKLLLKDGSHLNFGLCIWSTGVGPTDFIESLPFAKTNVGRLAVNSRMQVLLQEGQVCAVPGPTRAGCCFSVRHVKWR